MKLITVIFSILLMHSLRAQENKQHIDFSILLVPANISDLEFYQLGFHHDYSNRIAIGGSVNVWNAQSKVFNLSFHNTELSAGLKWYLFPNKKFFVDPSLHAVYHFSFIAPEFRTFRGAGARAGINAGYEFKKFGIGAMWQTSLAFGKYSYVDEQSNPSYNGLFWDFFDYGLFLSYKL